MSTEPICPLIGDPCMKHQCAWYDQVPAKPEEFKCRTALMVGMLDDVANINESARNTAEMVRALHVETLRSKALGKPTPELERIAGLTDIPRVDLPRR